MLYEVINMTNVINSKVAGISLHQEVVSELGPGTELVLEREKENQFDSNAIKILTKTGRHLGYVRKALAKDLARLIDTGVKVKCFVSVVTGENHSTKGVNLELRVDSPHEFF